MQEMRGQSAPARKEARHLITTPSSPNGMVPIRLSAGAWATRGNAGKLRQHPHHLGEPHQAPASYRGATLEKCCFSRQFFTELARCFDIITASSTSFSMAVRVVVRRRDDPHATGPTTSLASRQTTHRFRQGRQQGRRSQPSSYPQKARRGCNAEGRA